MFDRVPDALLVADLVSAQAAAPELDPARAAADLIEQVQAWDRVASWVEYQRLNAMRRFEAARTAADVDLVDTVDPESLPASQRVALRRLRAHAAEEAGRFAAEEIALALNISPTSAHQQLTLANDLHGVHRDLGEALELGQVSGFVASMVARATRRLPDEARRVIDETVTSDAVELPAGKAIAAARARVMEADEYAEAAVDRAPRYRYAFLKPLDDAMAMVGAVIPADDAIRSWARIDELARAGRAAGDPRTMDQLRADLVATALASRTTGPDAAATRDGARPDKPTSVQVAISLGSLLGLDSRSGWMDGYGSVTPGTIRRLLASGDATLTRLLCDPVTGAVLSADPTRYRPSDGLSHAVSCRDRHCRMPVCHARIRHLDHIRAAADAGLTTLTNLQGLCQRSHLAKHHPGWRVTGDADTTIVWTTPTGRRYASIPPPPTGYGTGPPHGLDDPLPPPDWLSHQQRLRTGLEAHHASASAPVP